MEIKEFIEKFAETIEVENVESLTPDTPFRDLEEWSSLAYLSVIVMMDEQFDIQIEQTEFKNLETIQDLYIACTKK